MLKQYSVRECFDGQVNHPHDLIYDQIKKNIRRQLPQVAYYPPAPYLSMLLCGGPSLNKYRAEVLYRRIQQGWKLFTVNGTYNWALDQGLLPSVQIIMDARPLNAEFVRQPIHSCKYMLCSQVHGDVFDALKGYDVHLWHGGAPSNVEKRTLDRFYMKRWQVVYGGTSVGLRAIMLAYMIGMRHLDVYGLDGCLDRKGRHHAYPQAQNDHRVVYVVRVGRRKFRMHGWMLKQFDEWLQFAPTIPDDYRLTIHGDGAIAYVTNLTAKQGRAPKMEVLNVES